MRILIFILLIALQAELSAQTEALEKLSTEKGFAGIILGKKMNSDTIYKIKELMVGNEVEGYWFMHDGSQLKTFYGLPIQSITIETNSKKVVEKISLWFRNDYSREKNDSNLDSLSSLLGPYEEFVEPERNGDRSLHRVWFYKKVHYLLNYFDSKKNKSGLLSLHMSFKKMVKKNK